MTFANRVRADWRQVLKGLLDRARKLGPSALFAFDLDSTLFDNRPRQALILREYGEARKDARLAACASEHWTSGWDMKGAMVACGLTPEEAESLHGDARTFWQERFFTSEYAVVDDAIKGAADFLRAAVETGATIAYVTGRHEAMRAGTVEAMRRNGFVLPGPRVHLLMKPDLTTHDDEFKRTAHAQLGTLGTLVAAFDNEPTHVNDYLTRFPQALAVHLVTDHSGRDVALLDAVVSVPDFDVGG